MGRPVALKVLRLAMEFGDMPDMTSSEYDFLTKSDPVKLTPETRKKFKDLVSGANLIVVDSDHALKIVEKCLKTNPVTQQVDIFDSKLKEQPICPPFKCQWIELGYKSVNSMAPSIKYSNYIITVLGMLIYESSPNNYDVYSLENHATIGGNSFNKFSVSRNVSGLIPNGSNLQMLFAAWMKAINDGSLCVEDGDDAILIPSENAKKSGKKKPFHINRVVRIVPKNHKHEVSPILNKGKIDFSHRWEVRGHWRKVQGVGKDREGLYEVYGHTWVKDFVKGPEHQPVIKKLRWVSGN